MKFNYKARTKQGEIQTGTVEAMDRGAAVETLQRHDLSVVSLEATSQVPFYARSLKIFERVKPKELVMFYRQLAILFEANIPLLDSLGAVAKQIKNPYFEEILSEVESDVRGGESLSQALAKHKKVFSDFYINVIKSGEATGKLSKVLKYLADHAEEEYVLNSKIKGAFSYPVFILSAFVLIAILMMVYVIPQLTKIFDQVETELPLLTKILIGTSDFFRSWFWLVGIVIVGAVIGLRYWVKTDPGRLAWDHFKLKIPILGKLFKKIYLTRFAENFSTLLKGGLPILEALEISSKVVGNKVFSNLISRAREEARKGGDISTAFERAEKNIPPSAVQMIKAGEKTASLDNILEKLANFYRGEVDRTVNNLTQLIEPALILILGAGVAFLVAAILMPIYNITSGGF